MTTQLQSRAHKSLVMSDASTGAEGDVRITLVMRGGCTSKPRWVGHAQARLTQFHMLLRRPLSL